MASYKVIQDIEAEDKLVGPLTLRQFIYGCIAALCVYLSAVSISKGFSLALVVLVPPALFAGFFAFPWSRDQPTEIWALAKIRFYIKSRKRIWSQSGVMDLVNITAPKHDTRQYTNGLSTHEVQSRLTALASTLDTRGWAVKNVYSVPPIANQASPDRLLDISNLPKDVPTIQVSAADDILDEDNNPRAQKLQQMVDAATQSHKQALMQKMQQASQAPSLPTPAASTTNTQPNYWFVGNTPAQGLRSQAAKVASQPVAEDISVVEEAKLSKELHQRHHDAEKFSGEEHLKTIQPLGQAPHHVSTHHQPQHTAEPPKPAVTPTSRPDTMRLANNNDLSVATLARIASKKDGGSGEVVISLR